MREGPEVSSRDAARKCKITKKAEWSDHNIHSALLNRTDLTHFKICFIRTSRNDSSNSASNL